MCEICIVVDRRNADGNSLADLVAALGHAGASIEQVDEERHVINALVPANDLAMIRLMEGVAYVRVVCHYHADRIERGDASTLVASG